MVLLGLDHCCRGEDPADVAGVDVAAAAAAGDGDASPGDDGLD